MTNAFASAGNACEEQKVEDVGDIDFTLRPSTTAVLQMPTLKGDDWTDEECAPKGATQPAETVAAAGQTSMPDSKNYEGIDALVANFNNLHEFR